MSEITKVFGVISATLWILIWGFSCSQHARADQEPRYKIAVIDTGYDPARAHVPAKLCKIGHYDSLTKTANINYYHPHGTQVVDLIAEKLKDVDYCIVIFQTMTTGNSKKPEATPEDIAKALNDSIGLGITAVNLSLSSETPAAAEEDGIKNVATARIPMFIAAGNKHRNLDYGCVAYPACYRYKNIVIVGAQDENFPNTPSPISNYGKRVTVWAPGYYHMGDESEWQASATSYAAPRALSEYILFLEHKRLQAASKHK